MTQPANILIVDDEQPHALLLAELMQKAGHQAITANDGFKALAACRVHVPDLIILDLHMPMLSGAEVLQRLRADEKTNHVPVIFISNKGEPIPNLENEGITEEDVMLKPFSPNELISRVKLALQNKVLSDRLKEKESQLKELSITDPITTCKSAQFLKEYLATSIKQSRRYQVPLSIIALELDRADEIQRKLSPEGCDQLIAELAKSLTKQLRGSDIIARTGPFELTIVLTVTDKNGAIEVAERLRTHIKQMTFTIGDTLHNCTASLGISQFSEALDEAGLTLLSYVKAALSQAHNSGGDVTLMAE